MPASRAPGETIFVAAKPAGSSVQTADGYSRDNLTAWVDESLRIWSPIGSISCNCTVHTPTCMTGPRCSVRSTICGGGKLRHYGVSVETVDEARRAIRFPNVQSVQIIFNLFRMKRRTFFADAMGRGSALWRACRWRAGC